VSPQRIQRRRTKGWRMPAGAVYVGRPSRWGNPYRIGDSVHVGPPWAGRDIVVEDARRAVDMYRQLWFSSTVRVLSMIPLLRGRDLVCWCPLDQPCHADVLLELANGGKS
jgi:uncharacterized protein DUF4326